VWSLQLEATSSFSAITQKESLSSYGMGMSVDPNVETELELTPKDLGPSYCPNSWKEASE